MSLLAPGVAPAALRRALAPHGAPCWLWRQGATFRNLSAAGLPDQLEAAARLLLDPVALAATIDAAPEVEAAAWPLLRPGRPGKALCLGKNFEAHAREFGSEPPEELVWFAKLPEVLIGPGEAVRIPAWLATRIDHEAELVLLLGAPLSEAAPEQARAAISAYTLGNDVTARHQQGLDRDRGWPWLRCKNLATFGPIGPEWVPAAALDDLDGRVLRARVNDQCRQEASLADLIWKPDEALAEISRWTPLAAGDVIFLGTPAGVGPLVPGDRVRVEMDGLGVLENPVVAASAS